MSVTCFLLEPVPIVRRILRRYRHAIPEEHCPSRGGYYNAEDVIGDFAKPVPGPGEPETVGPAIPRDHPHWPSRCATCGEPFEGADPWQVNDERLYQPSRGGALMTLRDAGPGAMWRASWYEGFKEYSGPDGHVYAVICPDGCEWIIDGPATGGGRWTRTGTPPVFTVTPSIRTPNWHGWLRGGDLVV